MRVEPHKFPPTYGLISSIREYCRVVAKIPPRLASIELFDALRNHAELWWKWQRDTEPLIDREHWPTATVDAVLWELAGVVESTPSFSRGASGARHQARHRDRCLTAQRLQYTGAGMAFWFSREEEFGDSLIRWGAPVLRHHLETVVDPDLLEEGFHPPVQQKFDGILDLRASIVAEQLELIAWRIHDTVGGEICG